MKYYLKSRNTLISILSNLANIGNYANGTNYLAISISIISVIRSCSDFTIMIRKNRNMCSNFFYILVDERVGEWVKNVLFRSLCKYFILN